MSKKWKIVLSVLGVLVVLGVGAVGIAVYFGAQFVNGMRVVAQDIYGGRLPSHVMPIMGLELKQKQQKMAVFMDTKTNMAVVVVAGPVKHAGKAPFSELDVKDALDDYGSSKETGSMMADAATGHAASFQLGKQTVHTLKFTDKEGKLSELGVLNLDKEQMVFIATGEGVAEDNSDEVANFLQNMPVLKNDSHLAAAAQAAPQASP